MSESHEGLHNIEFCRDRFRQVEEHLWQLQELHYEDIARARDEFEQLRQGLDQIRTELQRHQIEDVRALEVLNWLCSLVKRPWLVRTVVLLLLLNLIMLVFGLWSLRVDSNLQRQSSQLHELLDQLPSDLTSK